jgi:hypothetical protein
MLVHTSFIHPKTIPRTTPAILLLVVNPKNEGQKEGTEEGHAPKDVVLVLEVREVDFH